MIQKLLFSFIYVYSFILTYIGIHLWVLKEGKGSFQKSEYEACIELLSLKGLGFFVDLITMMSLVKAFFYHQKMFYSVWRQKIKCERQLKLYTTKYDKLLKLFPDTISPSMLDKAINERRESLKYIEQQLGYKSKMSK